MPRKDEARSGGAGSDGRRVRPARFFRAVVLTALAAGAPATGCYDSVEAYGVPPPDAEVSDDAGADDAADAGDTTPDAVPPYGVPDYGAPVYGVP